MNIKAIFTAATLSLWSSLAAQADTQHTPSTLAIPAPKIEVEQLQRYGEMFLFGDNDILKNMARRHDLDTGTYPLSTNEIDDFERAETMDVATVIRIYGVYPHAKQMIYVYYRALAYRGAAPELADERVRWMQATLRMGESAMFLAALDGEQQIYTAARRGNDCIVATLAGDANTDQIAVKCASVLATTLSPLLGVDLQFPRTD